MAPGAKKPVSAQDRQHAAQVAERVTKALHSAQFLQEELARLTVLDPKFAASWEEQAGRAEAQVGFLRGALEWATKAARGEWQR
jgi:hypothetical protein